MEGREAFVHGRERSAVSLGQQDEVCIRNLPVANDSPGGHVEVGHVVRPEFMPGKLRDAFQQKQGRCRSGADSLAQVEPDECAPR